MSKQYRKLERWGKFLLSCFLTDGTEVIEHYAYQQMSWRAIKEGSIYTLWGDSIFYEELASAWTDIIFEYDELIADWLNKDTKLSLIQNVLPMMRKRFVYYVIHNTRQEWVLDGKEWDLITQADIDDFYGQVIKTKVWNDGIVKKNSAIIATYSVLCSSNGYGVSDGVIEVEQEETFDFSNPALPLTKEFAEEEKTAWKKWTPKKYHKYIDAIDLTALKLNLKDAMGDPFIPIGRQQEVLLFMGRFNYYVTSRGSWKTFIISYLVRRQLFLPNQLIGVLLPDKNNYARPLFRFIRPSIKDIPWFKASMAGSNISIKNEVMDSEVIFFPGNKDPESSRGNTLDMLIIEEADFVVPAAVEAAKPSISRKILGNLFAITTVGKEKRGRFYQDLVTAELQMRMWDERYYAKRVTIHENPFIAEEEKKRLLEIERPKDPISFDREWMCSFTTEDSFDVTNFWVIDNEPYQIATSEGYIFNMASELKDPGIGFFPRYILFYDIARNAHKPWIVLLGEHPEGTVHIICAQYLSGSYVEQIKCIKFLQRLITRNETVDNFALAIDYLGVGIAVSEMLGMANIPHIPMENGWNTLSKDWFAEGKFKFSKERYINRLKALMSSGMIKGRSFMFDLMAEIEAYEWDDKATHKMSNWHWVHHFDILNALIMGSWFVAMMWFYKKIEKGVVREATEMMYGDMDWVLPDNIDWALSMREEMEEDYESSYVPRR